MLTSWTASQCNTQPLFCPHRASATRTPARESAALVVQGGSGGVSLQKEEEAPGPSPSSSGTSHTQILLHTCMCRCVHPTCTYTLQRRTRCCEHVLTHLPDVCYATQTSPCAQTHPLHIDLWIPACKLTSSCLHVHACVHKRVFLCNQAPQCRRVSRRPATTSTLRCLLHCEPCALEARK